MNSHYEILRYLINEPVINWNIIESQISRNVNVNVTHNNTQLTLLWVAFCADRHEIVFSLLNSGAEPCMITGYDCTTDVHRACLSESVAFLEILCENDEDCVGCWDVFGHTPLVCYILSVFDGISIPRDRARVRIFIDFI